MQKKGFLGDVLFILVILFFLAVGFLVVAFTNDIFRDVVTETQLNASNSSTAIVDSLDTISTKTIQRGFAVMFGLLFIGIIVSSFLVRVHPVWFFIFLFVLAVTILLAVYLGNVYQDLTEVNALEDIASEQTMTNWIMEHIVVLTLVMGVLGIIITFSKIFSSGGYTRVEGL